MHGPPEDESPEARRRRLIEARRCVSCESKLAPSEQGALCSGCYFQIITDPGLADPAPRF